MNKLFLLKFLVTSEHSSNTGKYLPDEHCALEHICSTVIIIAYSSTALTVIWSRIFSERWPDPQRSAISVTGKGNFREFCIWTIECMGKISSVLFLQETEVWEGSGVRRADPRSSLQRFHWPEQGLHGRWVTIPAKSRLKESRVCWFLY